MYVQSAVPSVELVQVNPSYLDFSSGFLEGDPVFDGNSHLFEGTRPGIRFSMCVT